MPKSENQKLKILYVAKYLLKNSDENHEVITSDIIDYLENYCELKAERRSIYRDINTLAQSLDNDNDLGILFIIVFNLLLFNSSIRTLTSKCRLTALM